MGGGQQARRKTEEGRLSGGGEAMMHAPPRRCNNLHDLTNPTHEDELVLGVHIRVSFDGIFDNFVRFFGAIR